MSLADRCAVDIYGFDRRTGTEHRLTPSSTVYPPGSLIGFDAFGGDGNYLVYVDARDPSCAILGLENDERDLCLSTVRVVDLATFSERELTSVGRSSMRVRAGQDAVAWLEATGDAKFELKHVRLSEPERVSSLGEVPFSLNFEEDRDWIVYQNAGGGGPTMERIHAPSGERRRLTGEGERGQGPLVRGGRAAWTDASKDALTLYDLATDRKISLVEVQ